MECKNTNADYKKKYLALRRNLRKYLKANRDMVDFMHEHLMDLCEEQQEEYEDLADKVAETHSDLGV